MSKTVEELLFAAIEKPTVAERSAFLDSACRGNAELRRQVERLLQAHGDVGDFLQKPVVEKLAAAAEPTDATQGLDVSTDREGRNALRNDGGRTSDDEDSALVFLQPSTRPDSLGRIGHYEVLQVLGKGGFGIVYRAFDETLQRVVAVKVMAPLLAATSPARKRFLREAQTSAQVRHENVVQVHEVGENPLPYLVMEFIPGETLQQRLDRIGPVEPGEVVRIGRQIAEGLAAAHATDLIHRDIKPGNILLEGAQLKVKITDFGLARAADDASLSQSGIIAGTPNYMSPEQAKGEKIDRRADLFSLGSVLYQMASGRPPFRANSTVAVLKRVADDTPRDIHEIVPETPPWLCDIIAKLHAKNPAERFQSAREVADLLADCEAQLKAHAKLKDLSRIPRKTPTPSRRRKWVPAAVVLVALLPLFALAATELTGVTQLLRPTPDAGPVVNAKKEQPEPPPVEKKTPPTPVKPDPEPTAKAKEPAVTANLDADRRAAEYVLSLGGTVKVNGQDQAITAAADLPRESFTLTYALLFDKPVTDAQLVVFKDCKNLTELILVGAETISDAGLACFKNCRNLTILNLNRTAVTAEGLAHFGECKSLTFLNLSATKATDAVLAHFKDCKNLAILDLSYIPLVTDAGLAHFKDCKNLTTISLRATKVTDAGMAHFKDCSNIERLYLESTQVGDVGLAHFKNCRNLVHLHLFGTQVSDAGLATFDDCKNLNSLELSNTSVGDVGLAHFKDCKNLFSLGLNSTQVSDAGLAYFKDCKQLTWVNLSNTQVGDAGLAHLKDCKMLERLEVKESKVTAAGVEDLRKAVPQCKIEWDGGVIPPR